MNKIILTLAFTLAIFINGFAQHGFVHESSAEYQWPEEQNIVEKLKEWQDMKFGVLFHWGLYSVPGIVESWSICSEDEDWIPRDSTVKYTDYKEWYFGLKDSFNPTDFNPQQWADVMQRAGMKYMIFTTKHHDGFNLFDTRQTDFSIMHGPFKNNPRANVTKYILQAFRDKDFMVGTYFSKPDWHSQYYWWDRYATPTRSVNYKIANHPQQWKKFQEFTFNQIEELMTGYGKVDILWLDGGWVAAPRQDIRMDKIADMARSHQKDILIVDRTIHGKYENYLTPERAIPDRQLPYPWESCIPLSPDWGWTPNAKFKTPNAVIADLIEVTAKGGNMLLGVGPTPEGIIQPEVEKILSDIGNWLNVNGEGIYGTRITPHYNSENVWFTESKDGKKRYAMFVPQPDSQLPASIVWQQNIPKAKSAVVLLQNGKKVKWQQKGDAIHVDLSKFKNLKNEPLVFSFEI